MELERDDFDLVEDNLCKLLKLSRQSMHQLNNNLTTILANTQLTLLMLKDEKLRHYLESVEDAARKAGYIVRSFQESTQSFTEDDHR